MSRIEAKLRRMKSDPVLFAEHILEFRPFTYQAEILGDPSKRIVACMGRQTGKSTTIAAKAVWFGIAHPRTTTLIVSATLRQSMLMFDKVLGYADRLALRSSVAYRSRTRLRFTNGSWIIALPCGRFGSTLRGHTADLVIVDEAAFIPQDVIASVVLPMISARDGSVWMLSTPWDKDHIFYRAFVDNSLGWSVYHLPSSVNPLIKTEFLEEQRNLIGEERFVMEYLAEFVDDAKSYFPMTLVRGCIQDYEPTPDSGMFVGYDPGGKESLSAAVGVQRVDGGWKVAYVKSTKSQSYTEENLKLKDLHDRYPFARLLVDQTGLGGPIVEHLRDLGLPAKGIVLTDQNKEAIFSNLKLLAESKQLTIPHSLDLINSLNAVEYERTRVGRYRFFHRSGTRDDVAFAVALACYAAKQEPEGALILA